MTPTPETADIAGLVEHDIWDVANQLASYVGPDTPEPLAAFLLRESEEAAKLATALQFLSAELAEAKANLPHPAWVVDFLNRRTEVENWLRAPANAQRKGLPVPTPPPPDEMERWANRLGVPGEVAAYSKQPDSYAELLTRAITAEAEARAMREALEPFAAEKMPSLRKTVRDYNEFGLRCMMSPMEIALLRARRALGGSNAE